MDDGLSLAVGGTALGAICTLVGTVVKARFSRTTVEPQPLAVKLDEKYASKDGNAEAHKELFLRVAAVEQAVAAIRAENSATRDALAEIKAELRDQNNLLMQILKGIKLP